MSETTREQLHQARKLLKSKNYDQARRLLLTIDHPTARKWLEKLDKIAPVKALGVRGMGGWLRDHILIAGILGLIVLIIGLLSGQALLNTVGIGGEKCDEETVTIWWQEQEMVMVDEFMPDLDGIIMGGAPGEYLTNRLAEMQQTRDTFAAAPVPKCADARVFGGYDQILNNIDATFVVLDDFNSGKLLPVRFGELIRPIRCEINAGRRAIDDAID